MESPAKYLDHELDALVESLLSEYHVPGLSIAVVDNGSVETKVSAQDKIHSTTNNRVECSPD